MPCPRSTEAVDNDELRKAREKMGIKGYNSSRWSNDMERASQQDIKKTIKEGAPPCPLRLRLETIFQSVKLTHV
jgi:hypothetical protein